jgi:hypothetical protein
MSWRDLNKFGLERGTGFYHTALAYAQYLWLGRYSARAILLLNRALYADLSGSEAVLQNWPLPYRALHWILGNHPGDSFLGNPRVSYQHLAGRIRGRNLQRRQWRAWACWYIVRQTLPELPPDLDETVEEPHSTAIFAGLEAYGIPGEAELWRSVVEV